MLYEDNSYLHFIKNFISHENRIFSHILWEIYGVWETTKLM